jgi:hypothetical protein
LSVILRSSAALQQHRGGTPNLQTPANTRTILGLSFVVSGLASGAYQFGLCGSSSSANWTNSDWGYTSALVF